MSSAIEPGTQYQRLVERAHRFVLDQGGAVPEDLLVMHVFGRTANPDLWRPLIRQILTGSDVLMLRGDGYWTTLTPGGEEAPPSTLLEAQFLVIDVETTGLQPFQNRVIEFAAARYRGGRCEETFSRLINPGRSVPAYVRKLTGIDDPLLADAPRFEDVAGQISAFIGTDPIIGYNTGFDVSFLNAEFKRAGWKRLVNEQIDLLPIAAWMRAGTRARGLQSLARELGIPVSGSHRALHDVETTANVLIALAPGLENAGIRLLEDLTRFRTRDGSRSNGSEPNGRARSVLRPQFVEDVPAVPGVYLMRDSAGRILYIGKAVDLRARIRSYYSQPLGYTRKMDGLIQQIANIETIETGCELSALLLEAQLIHRIRPQFNRQLRTSENYPYIKVDVANHWPKVSLARQPVDDDALYYGPYRSSRAARATVDALNDIYPLRTCNRNFKSAKSYGSPCAALDLGQCLGPCSGTANPDDYRAHVRDAIAFLDGDIEPVLRKLHEQLTHTAGRLEFERAARIRNRIERVGELAEAQKVLSTAIERPLLAIVLGAESPGAREIMLVSHGRPWSKTLLLPEDSEQLVLERLTRSWTRLQQHRFGPIGQMELDMVQIVERWLRHNWEHPSIVELDFDQPDFSFLAATARSVELIR